MADRTQGALWYQYYTLLSGCQLQAVLGRGWQKKLRVDYGANIPPIHNELTRSVAANCRQYRGGAGR